MVRASSSSHESNLAICMSLPEGTQASPQSETATQQYTPHSRTSLISSLLPLSSIHQPSAYTTEGKERAGTSRRMASSATAGLLSRQLKQMRTNLDIPGISCGLVDDNVFEWEVMIMMSDECRFYGGGFFRVLISYPPEYPLMPPKMKFETPIFHPNVYLSGEVCISILHPPEDDKYGYESASERWSPVQTPETILLSVISMLSSPTDESPANVDAAKLWRDDPKEFRKRCRRCVRDSLDG